MFFVVVWTYILTSPGETPYNYFARLSESLVNGKLYIEQNPPWLNELIPKDGKYYIVYPPTPAVLMMPLAFYFGAEIPQTLFSMILAGVNVVLVYFLLKRLEFSEKTSLIISLFFGFGTNHWYLASVGSSWFLAHITALTFLLLALIETFGKQRLFLIGLLLGLSFWARTPVIFTAGFFYIYLYKKFWPISSKGIRSFLLFSLGIGFFVLFDVFYNFLRFGQFSPFAPYELIPNLDKDPIFRDGFMNFYFIPRHLDALFLRLPKFIPQLPFMIPSLYSTAIWFTSPAIIYIFRAKINRLVLACWIGILFPLLMIFMWAGVGYVQWGYRFIQDIMPFILILLGFGVGNRPSKFAYFLIFLSIFINGWATILINKLSIFSF